MLTHKLEVNGVHIGVMQNGVHAEGQPALVLLHGFTGSSANWEQLFADLALPALHLVALDVLGHGQSAAPADPQRYTIEHCAADLLAVLQALGIKQGEASLLGYSLGGRIALYSAFTGYFRALILESASPGLATSAERELRQESDETLARCIEQDGVATFVDYWERLPLFANQLNLSPEKWYAQRAQRLQNRATGLTNSLRGVGTGAQPSLHERLPELDLPVLLIVGELDTKFRALNQHMAHQLPQARLEVVPGAGHTVHLEQPEHFISLVRAFCTTQLC